MSNWRVPLSDVQVDDELLSAATDVLMSGWWSMGPRVAELEEQFAAQLGSAHALAVSSGTAALHLALLALDCGPGDEVVLPSLNFVAAANAVTHAGATPVFCDIVGEEDLNLDPEDLAAAVSPRTKAVIVLHYAGYACDLAAVETLAARHGFVIIEDAAHGPGATWRGRPLGSIGSVGCFSFFSNKNLPVGEGGMVTTSDSGLADRLRLLRSHGMTTLTWQRHQGHASAYDVVQPGFNYRIDELRAAIASVQLRRLVGGNAARRAHAARYRERLGGAEGLSIPFSDDGQFEASAHHLAVVLLERPVSRDTVREALHAEGIQTSVHYPPIHRFSAYAGVGARRPLPRTDDVADRIMTLPLFPHMSEEDVDFVSATLVEALASELARTASN